MLPDFNVYAKPSHEAKLCKTIRYFLIFLHVFYSILNTTYFVRMIKVRIIFSSGAQNSFPLF